MNKLEIRHHNIISDAIYYYTPQEFNLFAYLIAHTTPEEEIYLNSKEIRLFMGLRRRSYKEFERLLDNFAQKYILIKEENIRVKYYVFSSLKFIENTQFISIKLNDDIRHFILNLKNNFTVYDFKNFIKLKKTYSKRFYQILHRYRFNKINFNFVLSIVEIKELFNLDSKIYKETKYILRELRKTINEINEKTMYNVNIVFIRKGREIHSIKFEIIEDIVYSQELKKVIEEAKKNIYISKSALLSKKININKLLNIFGEEKLIKGLRLAYRNINSEIKSLNYIIKVIENNRCEDSKQLRLIPKKATFEKTGLEDGKISQRFIFTEEEIDMALINLEKNGVSISFLKELRKRSPTIFIHTVAEYILKEDRNIV